MRSILDAKLAASVDVNGLWIPFPRLPEAIRRFCAPALFVHDDPAFELTKSGSALLIKYKGRYFAICTKHQFGHSSRPLSQQDPRRFAVAIRRENGRFSGLTPWIYGDITVQTEGYESLNDLFLLEFAAQFHKAWEGRFLRLDLSLTHDELAEQRLVFSFAIGFPTYAVRYLSPEFDDVDHPAFAAPWTKIYLEDDQNYVRQPMDPEHRRFMIQSERFKQRELPDPDGLSGAPVFTVWRSGGQIGYVLAGIITHARGRSFAVYPAVHIRHVLDEWILD